jgi:hypothetical protein
MTSMPTSILFSFKKRFSSYIKLLEVKGIRTFHTYRTEKKLDFSIVMLIDGFIKIILNTGLKSVNC